MNSIRLRDVSEEQMQRAYELACREAGLGDNPPVYLTPFQAFKMSAVAENAVLTVVRADAQHREIRP